MFKKIMLVFALAAVGTILAEPIRSMLAADGTETIVGDDLPYDAEVEWLETDGNAYIDTGLEMGDGHEVRALHIFKNATRRQLMGSNGSRQYYGVNASGYIEFGQLPNNTSTVVVDESKTYLIVYSAANGYNTSSVYEDGILLWSGSGAYYSFTGSFKIFRIFLSTGQPFVAGNKILAFEHLIDGEVVQSLIPVRIGEVGYMYDKVTGEIFGNPGKGAFIVGPDKED